MSVSRHLARRQRQLRPLEDMEVALVRASLESPGWLSPVAEGRLRYALSLARLTEVRTSDGRDVDLGDDVAALRGRLNETLAPFLLDRRGLVERPQVASLVPMIWELASDHRDRLRERTKNRIAWEDVEREIREKVLVVAAGGGGGVGYVYLGAFHALEERGIQPSLLSGTSIGAILSAFRARAGRFDVSEVADVVRELSWGQIFRPTSLLTRYGLPAPLRLYLRAGIGRHFRRDDGEVMRGGDTAIPLLVTIAGLRRGELPHEDQWYEHRLADVSLPGGGGLFRIGRTRRIVGNLWRTLSDFVSHPEMLKPLVLGADAVTREFDIVDAIGFSSAVPGLIHYDIAREDPRMETLLEDVLEREGIGRLLDGGLVDNVPARAAWRAVQNGMGRRNALVVACDAFAPKLTAPLWLPIQRLARLTVRPNLRYAHVVKTFLRTLSPLELVPNVPHILKAVRQGREEFAYELPLIERLLTPITDID